MEYKKLLKPTFQKNVEELTLAESAALAGIVKGPSKYDLYKTVKPENLMLKTC